MFWRNKKTQYEIDTEATIKDLRQRIEQLESATAPLRVGELDATVHFMWGYLSPDPRPTVTQERAIRMLLDHCGVELKKIDGTPDRIILEKKSKRAA